MKLDVTDRAILAALQKDAGLSNKELARKIRLAPSSCLQRVRRLREAGLADDEIVDVAAAAAARCFFTKIIDGLGAQADAAFAELDPALRDVLVVGRPIEGDG